MLDKIKEFKPSSWSINNKVSIYVLTVIITLVGLGSYMGLPKEKFPDIVIPTIFVSTVNAGASPSDMETLVTRPLEKKIRSISGIKKVTSNSLQDYSVITVEFNTDVEVSDALQKVKDKIDEARDDRPDDLTEEPTAKEVDISEVPIMYVNISGDFEVNQLKKYADELQDQIESLKEINRVDIVGALEREFQVNLDMYKMEAAKITTADVERAIASENMTIPAGQLTTGTMKRTIRVQGEIKKASDLKNIIVKSSTGAPVYLRDIAVIKDTYAERESYARLDHKNVITLNVIKRSGENLIESADKIRGVVADLQENHFPDKLKITISGDMSKETKHTVNELINTIIIGFVLVVLILMFFMGVTNAIFVGLSVPLSCFIAFMVLGGIGFSMNMIVLFSFLLALGIVVDDAIVVIENTHRIYDNGKVPIVGAAKQAAGEVFLPVFTGTITTLAPFVPLAFWGGIIGKFMYFLPITLIITLLASLVVAYIINPVFAVDFMRPHHKTPKGIPFRVKYKGFIISSIIMAVMAAIFHITGAHGLGNFAIFMILLSALYRFVLLGLIEKFQEKVWPKFQRGYEKVLSAILTGRRPYYLFAATVLLFFGTFFIIGIAKPKVGFFPKGEPNFVYVFLTMPVGTDVAVTDSVTKEIEKRVYSVIGDSNPLVESVISNVAVGASDPADNDFTTASNKGRVAIAFVEYAQRNGASTTKIMGKIRDAVQGIAGAQITVDQERNGPPTGKPINIELSGQDYDQLAQVSEAFRRHLDSLQIPGIEELKSDLVASKPEIIINVDRERAQREGLSTAQIGSEIRTAIFGKEASTIKDNEDEYSIQLRYLPEQRENLDEVMNLKITYRDMGMGGIIRQVPLSSVASYAFTNSYGGIKRKNGKRVITISSNVLAGYTPNEIIPSIIAAGKNFKFPADVSFSLTGEQEDQKESMSFLGNAMLISLGIILLVLVTQFNSIGKPLIILSEVIFSVIGVLLGFIIFDMEISVIMTGIGIVALGGIVVRNGIVLVEFMDELKMRGYKTRKAIIEAGKIRMTPVILTATATMLGLIPLAIGFNINFVTMFTELNPHIYLGGDSVKFWGPLSWTIIFGLSFATFLTLILVPAMYYMVYTGDVKRKRIATNIKAGSKKGKKRLEQTPTIMN